MLIKTKLRLGSILLTLVPAIAASTLIGWNAIDHAELALHDQAKARLTSVREEKIGQITRYFETLDNLVLAYAKSRMTGDAMRYMSSSFHSLASGTAHERDELRGYYSGGFAAEYAKRNSGQQPDASGILAKLGDRAVAVQRAYVQKNPNPVGEKDKYNESDDGSGYSGMHAVYHPAFRELQQRFGFRDLYLVDADTGDIVYSVFKEIDFGTSLKSGPFADSGLAAAYNGAMKVDEGATFMTDFSSYLPAYREESAFIAAPIFRAGMRFGVFVARLDSGTMDAIMTSKGRWKETGLGESGETYLVGPDFKMRSQSRFWLEDPKGYTAALRGAGVDDATVSAIEAQRSVVGLQSVNSPGAKQALQGETGFAAYPDYRGVPVLSAYAPLEVGGNRWAILAEVDQAEAYDAADELHRDVVLMIVAVGVVLVVISAVLGWLFSAALSRPLESIVVSMKDISSGSGDLTARLNDQSKDELGHLAGAFNQFVAKLDSIMSQVSDSTNELATTAEELSAITRDSRQGVEQQQHEVQQVAAAIDEMSASVREVAENTHATAQAATQVGEQVNAGKGVLERSVGAVQQLHDRMGKTRGVVEALQEDSTRVGTVLDVIRGIAEQTNLLALNAAIEAARAGEQGRGFAVVADEVRTLAMRTQQSTEEIRTIIESLQSRSDETVQMLRANGQDIETTVDLSEQTQHAFAEIEGAMQKLLDMSTQIASASEEQAAVTEEIGRNVDKISQVAQSTAAGAEQTESSSQMLAGLGDRLKSLVNQFRISGT